MSRRTFLRMSGYFLATSRLIAACAAVDNKMISETAHRPWPLPQTRWVMFMRWHDLVFLHWPVAPEILRPLIPRDVDLDTFDGQCWIGVVPFHMSGVRLRYTPFSFAFPELNVRTYVKTDGRPGVWFFSLDAANWLAVRAARKMNLPYYDAEMRVETTGEEIEYRSARLRQGDANFAASYRPIGPIYHAPRGTLDHWLTERYRLYAAFKSQKVVYGDIHHRQWPLQAAEAEIRTNTMTRPVGVKLPDTRPICHFARYQEVVAWPIVKLTSQ
jgi:uncharacterized protein YqjF (DUF2071 family)